jgi:DNA-directed RNA polymerase beta subunit
MLHITILHPITIPHIMDVLDSILTRGVAAIDASTWQPLQEKLKNAFLGRRGTMEDELTVFNSFLDDALQLVQEHYHPSFVDAENHMHELIVMSVYAARPYFQGIDDPERASLHGSYEAKVFGTVVYRIRVQPGHDIPEGKMAPGDADDTNIEDANIEDANIEDDTIIEDANIEDANIEDDTIIEDATMEDEHEIGDEEEEEPCEEEPCEEEPCGDEPGGEDQEPPQLAEEDVALDELQPATPTSSVCEEEVGEDAAGIDLEDPQEAEFYEDPDVAAHAPSVSEPVSAHTPISTVRPWPERAPESWQPGVTAPLTEWNQNFSYVDPHAHGYTEILHEAWHHDFHLLDLPVLIRSQLCFMDTSYGNPLLYFKEFMRGGTFMVNRLFKVCPYEETYTTNQCLLHEEGKVTIRCKFADASKKYRTNSTLHISLDRARMRKHATMKDQRDQPARFLVEIPHERPKQMISVTTLAWAMGWPPEQLVDAVRMFLRLEHNRVVDSLLRLLLQDVDRCQNQAAALQRVGHCFLKCRRSNDAVEIASYACFVIHGEILPHLVEPVHTPTPESLARENHRKGLALAEAVAHLIRTSHEVRLFHQVEQGGNSAGQSGAEQPSQSLYTLHNKHDFTWKRLVTPGLMLNLLLRKFMREATNKASGLLRRTFEAGKPLLLDQIMNHRVIRMTQAVKNGVFDVKSDTHEANQNKTRMLITGFCSDATRIQSQSILKVAMKKNSEAKRLMTDPGQMGRIDAYLTPQSDSCGVMRFKTLGCVISPVVNLRFIHQVLNRELQAHQQEWGVIWADQVRFPQPPTYTGRFTLLKDVFGGLWGWTLQPLQVYLHFVTLRRQCRVYDYLSLHWDRALGVLTFYAEEERLLRPLIVMSALPRLQVLLSDPKLLYHEDPVQALMEAGCVEYLDAAEEMSGMVLVAESMEAAQHGGMEQTHMELHMLFHFSILVAGSHFHMNAGARRMYTGCMQNRTIGLKVFTELGTTESHSLVYGQVPLSSDPVDEVLQLRSREPNGINAILGIVSHDSNMEDACTMSKSAVELGLGLAWEHHTHTVTLTETARFKRPAHDTSVRHADARYAHLPADGIPRVGTRIPVGGAMIGKVLYAAARGNHADAEWCDSKFNPLNEICTVTHVDTEPRDHPHTVRVTISVLRSLEVSNKIQIGHGQKMTIGHLVSREDMPFVEYGPMSGTTFDLMINTCSLKRVTQGLFLDMLEGQAHALSPSSISQYRTMIDHSETYADRIRLVSHLLKRQGFSYDGKVHARCGTTGESLPCLIFCGPIQLHVLPHRGRTKLRSRERGRVDPLTHQTSSGKKNFGGLRLGELEAWNTHSLGITAFSRNAHYTCADRFRVFWCVPCAMPALGSTDGFYWCHGCKSRQHIVRLQVPYTTNLVQQELLTCGYGMRYETQALAPEEVSFMDEEAYLHQQQRKQESEVP